MCGWAALGSSSIQPGSSQVPQGRGVLHDRRNAQQFTQAEAASRRDSTQTLGAMTRTGLDRTWKALSWLSDGIWNLVLVTFAIAFLGSGIFAGNPGLVVCGIGWTLGLIAPVFLRGSAAKRLAWPLRIVGALVFLLGLAVHGGPF